MSQNISLWGATYSDVPSIEVPKSGGGTASFTDVTDTTATASDVASGKYFYLANGARTEGTGSGGGGSVTQDANGYIVLPSTGGSGSPTLITKSITANGTYNASSDNADGYSSVTVNVSGGGATLHTATAPTKANPSTGTYTLTFSNISSAPSMFFLMLTPQQLAYTPDEYAAYFNISYSNILTSCIYDGTNTKLIFGSDGSNSLYSFPQSFLPSSDFTWSYNSGTHTLTFTDNAGWNSFANSDSEYTTYPAIPYTLYYI